MYKNPESQDKNIRDIIEGPPRMESTKKFESMENKTDQSSQKEKVESQSTSTTTMITKETAHRIGLTLLPDREFVEKIKELVKERLVKGEKITRLDTAITNQEVIKEPYGLSKAHLVESFDKNFLNFDIIRDGDDLALTFQKTTGDRAVRSFDDETLAEMLNRLLRSNPGLNSAITNEVEHISSK